MRLTHVRDSQTDETLNQWRPAIGGRGYTAKDSEFHLVTCFNGLGQNVAKFCSKGQLVTVEGRIHYTQWEDQDGTKRYGCEIIADKVDFLTKGRGTSGESAPDIDED